MYDEKMEESEEYFDTEQEEKDSEAYADRGTGSLPAAENNSPSQESYQEFEGEYTDSPDYEKESDDPEGEESDGECAELSSLAAEFPELSGIRSVTQLKNPLRYAALRDLGLTPREAYLATSFPIRQKKTTSHLTSSVPRAASPIGTGMSASEMRRARELFSGLSDAEIYKLYKRVTQN